uniref:peroxide stress protein YaaA n=1 Tax=Flavobacterium sp. TaxID=239 RepID=UPI004048F1F4
MKLVISPAKSLDFESKLPTEFHTTSRFLDDSKQIDKVLKTKSTKVLEKMMSISNNLATLNWQRNQERNLENIDFSNARQAIFAFNGDVYSGFDAYSIEESKYESLQNSVRILSGLFGILKPFDLMQPYRLEMGTKLQIKTKKDLYDFWQNKITASLNDELSENEIFINLASQEYFGAINPKKLKVPVITPEFKDFSNGKLKIISFYAKKARGLMARYLIDHDIDTVEEIKLFNTDGYQFDATLSEGNKLVFTR